MAAVLLMTLITIIIISGIVAADLNARTTSEKTELQQLQQTLVDKGLATFTPTIVQSTFKLLEGEKP